MTAADIIAATGDGLARLKANTPRVHAITNAVAQPITANGLLALGAVPSLTVNPQEIADFTARADALLINLGMLDRDRIDAIEAAVTVVREAGRPYVLDPVFADRSPARAALARALIRRRPGVVRLNATEFDALADGDRDPATAAIAWLTTIALTGETDSITDGARTVTIRNGTPLLAQVTATGCLLAAIIAAFRAVALAPVEAAAAGVLTLNIAAEMAADTASGPGSFAVGLIDALSQIGPAAIADRARLETTSLEP